MNLTYVGAPVTITAKTCSYRENNSKKVMYTFLDSYTHILCVDKKEIIMAQFEACVKLLESTIDKTEKKAIEKEIAELKLTLDLMP
jgi:hypothetical protein